ncbi:MAG: hypothetical protein ABIR56_11910 [Polaromonas sp.]
MFSAMPMAKALLNSAGHGNARDRVRRSWRLFRIMERGGMKGAAEKYAPGPVQSLAQSGGDQAEAFAVEFLNRQIGLAGDVHGFSFGL